MWGPSDYVIDGFNGYLSPVGDVDSMVGNILKLIKDNKLYFNFSMNGYNFVRENFSFNKFYSIISSAMIEAYSDLHKDFFSYIREDDSSFDEVA